MNVGANGRLWRVVVLALALACVASGGVAAALAEEGARAGLEIGQQWVSGRVVGLGDRVLPIEGEQLATVLEELGLLAPPSGTTVALIRVLPRYQRLVALMEGRSPAAAVSVKVDGHGRFRLLTPDAGPWRVVANAPGSVSMETYLPRLPAHVELATVWLQPGVEEGVQFEASEPAWVASVLSESAVFAAQRRLGRWQRVPIRLWSDAPTDGIAEVSIVRAKGETLLLVKEGHNREAFFLAAPDGVRSQSEDPVANLVFEGRGSVVTDAVRLVNDEGAAPGVVVIVDGRPVGASDGEGRVKGAFSEGALVEAVAPNGAWARLSIGASDGPVEELVITLQEPRTTSLLVRDEHTDRPIQGAELRGSTDTADERGELLMVLDAGSLHANQDDANAEPVFAATVNAVGYLEQQSVIETGPDQVVEVRLTRRAIVEGKVIDRRSAGVVGVDLLAVALEGDQPARWGRTDDEGLFRIQQLAPDVRYALFALHPDYPLRPMGFRAPPAGERRQDVVVELFRPFDAFGWVLSDDGLTVEGATVALRGNPSRNRARSSGTLQLASARPSPPLVLETTTDSDGRFVFWDTATGEFGVEVSAPGMASVFVPRQSLDLDSARSVGGRLEYDIGSFTMIPEAVIQVQVVDVDGTGVSPAIVWWTSVSVPTGSATRFATRSPDRITSRDPPWFNVDVSEEGAAALSGVEPYAAVSLLVEAPGFVSRRVDGLVVDWGVATGLVDGEAVDPVIVPLVKAAAVSGVVLSDGGRGLENAHVSVHPLEGQVDFPDAAFVRTDSSGRFSLIGLPRGSIRLIANAVDAAVIVPVELILETGEELTNVELRAPPSAVVAGRVIGPDGPIVGATVVSDLRAATTDGEGEFRIDYVRLGAQRVEVRRHDDLGRSIMVGAGENWIEIELTESPSSDRLLEEAGSVERFTVRGRVLSDDRLAPRVVVLGPTDRSYNLRVDDDGRFVAEGLRRGTYTIAAVSQGGTASSGRRTDREMVRVVDHDIDGVVLDLQGAQFAEIVFNVTGLEPIEEERLVRFGLPVRLRGATPTALQYGGTQTGWVARWRDGLFVVGDLEAGDWSVEASVADGLYQASAEVVLREGQSEQVELRFERADRERISGVLVIDGQPAPGWIAARPLDTDGTRTVTTLPGFGGGAGTAQANALGQFEITLQPGQARLMVSVGNAAMGTFEVFVVPGQPIRLEAQQVDLRGTVLNADGTPAEGLRVTSSTVERSFGSWGRSMSGTDGTFQFKTLSTGDPLTIQVARDRDGTVLWQSTVSPDSQVGEILVTLPP